MEIRDKGYYREVLGFETFEAYCKAKWDMGRNYMNKIIASSVVMENLGTIVPIKPITETQARPLARLEPQRQREAWQRAVETAPEGKVTAAHVCKYEVGLALMQIRDSKLYRATHQTFEDYCKDRWDITKTHANRLIGSASAIEHLTPTGVILPESERQARPLTKLGAELQREAWQRAVETAPEGKVPPAHVYKYEVGLALMQIRDSRLYRATHKTFEEYCKDRWDISKMHAYRLIDASVVIGTIKSNQLVTPANEAQARPLTRLGAELQKEAWQRAVETAPEGKVTAAHVCKIVSDLGGKGKSGRMLMKGRS